MKTTMTTKLITASAILLMSVLAFSSCTTKKYYENGGLDIDPFYYYPHKSEFSWNQNLGRWEYSKNDSGLTKYQVDDMEVAGTIVTGDSFRPMPFVESYYYITDLGEWIPVTQSYGFEVTYGRVTFFVQTNEKNFTWEDMPNEFEFKLSLFYWR